MIKITFLWYNVIIKKINLMFRVSRNNSTSTMARDFIQMKKLDPISGVGSTEAR